MQRSKPFWNFCLSVFQKRIALLFGKLPWAQRCADALKKWQLGCFVAKKGPSLWQIWQIPHCLIFYFFFLHFIASVLPAVSAQCSGVLDQCPCPARRCVRVWGVIADHDVCLGPDHRQPCMASPLSPAALTGLVMGCLQEPARSSLARRSEIGRRNRVAKTTSRRESITHLLSGALSEFTLIVEAR